MKPTIHLALTDDWELRGDGSGDIERIQFAPMRELVSIYNRHGVRASFNAELMQQLTFRKFQDEHRELRAHADTWDEHVRETYRAGHDVQLHIHPQWSGARYENGRWRSDADWSLLNYDEQAAYQMIADGKEYLENLLRPLDASYRCVSFRAGAWCIAPSPHLLPTLVKLGIVFDMSIVGGLHYDTRRVQLDYRNCEETFLPFYPVMDDARRVSDKREEIVCVPTFHFHASRRHVFKHHLSAIRRKGRARVAPSKAVAPVPEGYEQEWAQVGHQSPFTRLYEKGVRPYLKGKHLVSDIAQLNDELLCELLDAVRRRARATGLRELPVILTNHTKDVQDFSPIERFVAAASKADDIEFVTLAQLADKLRRGEFAVRKNSA
ncbi:MAG TPA: hypothetical protein VM934_12125 [Pyrinomonadaceae bacterium]|nr:hypothetical protein [Pyrinomonadaceae bacterium]